VARFVGEPATAQVDELLRNAAPASISALNLAEVVDILVRVRGHDRDIVREKVDLLIAAGLQVEPIWLREMWLATSLRADHYHRTRSPVSIADCVCVATAISLGTDLATTDHALADMARSSGVAVIALPDSDGRVPNVGGGQRW
jgi:predicted nucleic acid-binding protein